MLIGVISDTHGLLRPEACAALAGVDAILHAGDIGSAAVLDGLSALAPLHLIRGNNDTGAWALGIPDTLSLSLGGHRVYLLHDLAALTLDPRKEGLSVVVSGHSHRPSVTERDGVLHLNPGSAGPRRFRLPVSLALLRLSVGAPTARVLHLQA